MIQDQSPPKESLVRDRRDSRPASRPFLLAALPAALVAVGLTACAVGPDYQRPAAPEGSQAAQFKENQGWKPATPGEIDARQPWWERYRDPLLNELVAQAREANASLQQAAAQYQQAKALVQAAGAPGLPTLGLSASASRQRTDSGAVFEGNVHNVALQAGWEPDLWGHVNGSVEAAQAGAAASAADLAAAQLSVQALVVNAYLQLRVDDALLALYARTVQGYEKSLLLTQSQYRAGVATSADVALAQATLEGARAQATDLGLLRKQLEHAIAVLLGRLPSAFSLPPAPEALAAVPRLPSLPALLPAELLERRPDIAAAERRVAQANANIGVARSAWFPKLTLSASGGNSGLGLGNWLASPYQVWALGAQLAASLYDGGLRQAQDQQALAAFNAAAAGYRQVVLNGFQEVEDNLAALDELAREQGQLSAAAAAARKSEQVLTSQYRAGSAPYLSVITAQALTLGNERAALQAQGRLLAASVNLIKATGGGWTSHQE